MAGDNTLARSLHDLGAAAWFGGALMGAVGLTAASRAVDDPTDRIEVEGAGWAAWTPFQWGGIAAHLAGGLLLTSGNKARIATQSDALGRVVLKTLVTGAALGATVYSGVVGQRVRDDAPAEASTEPGASTPAETAAKQRRLQASQWVVPVLTGALIVLGARQGEAQRPRSVIRGVARRLRPVA